MTNTEFNLMPTIIGSMPHQDPEAACKVISRYLTELPAWPQLPRRDWRELMTTQYSEGFPGIDITEDKITARRPEGWDTQLIELYGDYIASEPARYAMSREFAAGFHSFLTNHPAAPKGVKGQVVGPITWGLSVKDELDTPAVYDEVLAEASAKLLCLKTIWQEAQLREISPRTVVFIDEPALSSFGSAYLPLSKEIIQALLTELLGSIRGVKGIHCCGNTDWTLLTETSVDIISFDAYNYAGSLSLYPDEICRFVKRGGGIAWGITPNTDKGAQEETSSSLKDRLEEAISPFTRQGLEFRQILRHSIITPSCGMAYMSDEGAERLLELMVELTHIMRGRYL